MAIEFYYHPQSPPSCVVWMILKELGIDYKGNKVDLMKDEQKSESYAKISPNREVPAIKDGDFNLSQSRSIAIYLCLKYEKADKKNKLYPRDLKEQARFHELMMRDVDNYQSIGRYLNGEAIFTGRANSVVDALLPKCEAILKEYDDLLAKHEFIFGSHLTFLDYTCAHTVTAMTMGGYKDWDKYPNLKKWKTTLSKLPYFEECIKKPAEANRQLFEMLLKKGPDALKALAELEKK